MSMRREQVGDEASGRGKRQGRGEEMGQSRRQKQRQGSLKNRGR